MAGKPTIIPFARPAVGSTSWQFDTDSLPVARAGADGFALTATHFIVPPAIFLHSSVPAVLRVPELLQVPPDTSVTTVVVVEGGVVEVVVVIGNVTGVGKSGCVLDVEPEHFMRPDVAFVFHEAAVFNKDVLELPLALEAADVKFFDCCVCETKYFDL